MKPALPFRPCPAPRIDGRRRPVSIAAIARAAKVAATAAVSCALWLAPAQAMMVGSVQTYRTTAADTLHDIAVRFDLGYVELIAANPGIDPWLPGIGIDLTLPLAHIPPKAPAEGIVINLSEMRLYFYPPGSDGAPVSYPVGIGKEGWETPVGATRVVRKQERPTWYPPASIRAERPELPAVVPPGPENPLGNHAIYLGWPAYLIHGTNKPPGVGRRVSSGCIRMYPADVAALFSRVEPGTPVTVVDQPIKFGWHDGELYVEAHLPQDQADSYTFTGSFEADIPRGLVNDAAFMAGDAVDRLDFDALRQAVLERRGYPVRITR